MTGTPRSRLLRLRGPAPVLASLCLAAALAACGEKRDALALPSTPTHLVVALAGPPGAAVAPLYAAIASGDLARAGITVAIRPAPAPALTDLVSGAADIAVVSEPDLLRARDHGAAVVAIASIVRSPLDAIISIAPHPITKATQLQGATVAVPATPLAGAELDTILRRAGVPPASVKRRDPGPDPVAPLVSKTAVASLGSWNSDAVRLARRRPNVIKVEDAGVPTYDGLVLIVRQSEARSRGPVLRTFLQALKAGVRATLTDPGAAVAPLVAANPELGARLELASLKATLPVIDPTPTGSPYGFVDPRVWRTFGRWMLAQGLLTRPDDAARAVTNEFLPGQGE